MKTPRRTQLATITIAALAAVLPVAAQTPTFTDFRFMSKTIGWEDDLIGTIDNEAYTVTFATQKWIENIAGLSAVFELDRDVNYEVKVGKTLQKSGVTTNDFHKDVIYRINDDVEYTVKFVSPQASGLPVIRIDTKGGAPILDRENYVNMTFTLTDPNNSGNNITVVNDENGIRGRGNSTWNYAKKPYRIKFDKKQSLFGLPAAKSWVLLAEYLDPMLIKNTAAFELGDRFGLRYNHTYHHVTLYLNGNYQGQYTLTEQNQTGEGRVDIDKNDGWLVELDFRYEEEPKFRTTNYDMPVTIKSPEVEPLDISNTAYDFVRNDINELCDSMASTGFPENGYRDLIDMQQFISYFMVPVIIGYGDFDALGSVFIYKDKNEKICMGPLWDYDMTFGYILQYTPPYNAGHFPKSKPIPTHSPFLARFFQDYVFLVRWKEFWNSKYSEIYSMLSFVDETAHNISRSAAENFKIWWQLDFYEQIGIMKSYYNTRIAYLNEEYNKVDILPNNKTFTTNVFGYTETDSQTFTLVSYGDMAGLSVTLKKAESLGFEISPKLTKTPTGNGGYLATISVKPKIGLSAAAYTDTLILSGTNQGKTFSLEVPLSFTVSTKISVLSPDRVIPQSKPAEEATVIAPVTVLSGEFTAGPNPVAKSSDVVNFFRQGKRVAACELRIYDANGNIINKVKINDNAIGTQARRKVGAWDLKDRNGRLVSEGTYLVKGVIKTSDGKSEKVSLIVGVR